MEDESNEFENEFENELVKSANESTIGRSCESGSKSMVGRLQVWKLRSDSMIGRLKPDTAQWSRRQSTVQLFNCNILISSSCAMKMTNLDEKYIDEEVNETI